MASQAVLQDRAFAICYLLFVNEPKASRTAYGVAEGPLKTGIDSPQRHKEHKVRTKFCYPFVFVSSVSLADVAEGGDWGVVCFVVNSGFCTLLCSKNQNAPKRVLIIL